MTKTNRRSDDPTTASALAAHYYVSTEIFQREIEAIFFRSWQFAGYTFDIKAPGDFFTSTIFDQSIVVVRDRAGEIGAFHNVCAHRGHELVSGRGNALILTCPYHAWSYDLGGKLRAAGNAENVAGFDVAEFSLASIRVETLGPLVFVNLDSKAEPLDSACGDLLREFRATIPHFDDLRLYRRSEIPVAANWKVIIENGHECYHCPNVHAEFFGADERPSFESSDHRRYSTHIIRGDSEIRLPYDFGSQEPIEDLFFWIMWPNTMFVTRPGESNFQVFQIVPTGPEGSCEILDDLSVRIPPRETERAMFDGFRDLLNPQDVAVCESVQRGLRSRWFRPGRLMVDTPRSWRSEQSIHHFNQQVLAALDEANPI